MLNGWYSRVATTSGVSCSGNHISTLAGYSKPGGATPTIVAGVSKFKLLRRSPDRRRTAAATERS